MDDDFKKKILQQNGKKVHDFKLRIFCIYMQTSNYY